MIRHSVGTFSRHSQARVRARLRSEPLAVGAGADSGVPLKELPKERGILIADGVTDLLHGAMVALEKALGRGDSQLLQVDQRTVSGSLLKAANEIARAHADAMRGSLERERPVKILMQPLLRAGDGVVGVLGFQRDDSEASLPCAGRVDEQRLGALHGNVVAAKFLDQI